MVLTRSDLAHLRDIGVTDSKESNPDLSYMSDGEVKELKYKMLKLERDNNSLNKRLIEQQSKSQVDFIWLVTAGFLVFGLIAMVLSNQK